MKLFSSNYFFVSSRPVALVSCISHPLPESVYEQARPANLPLRSIPPKSIFPPVRKRVSSSRKSVFGPLPFMKPRAATGLPCRPAQRANFRHRSTRYWEIDLVSRDSFFGDLYSK